MRWNSAHVGNIRQAPEEGQEVVNPEMKVPDEQESAFVEDEEAEPKRSARVAEARARAAAQAPEARSSGARNVRDIQPAASSGTFLARARQAEVVTTRGQGFTLAPPGSARGVSARSEVRRHRRGPGNTS